MGKKEATRHNQSFIKLPLSEKEIKDAREKLKNMGESLHNSPVGTKLLEIDKYDEPSVLAIKTKDGWVDRDGDLSLSKQNIDDTISFNAKGGNPLFTETPSDAREKLKDMGEKDGGKKGGPMAGKFGLPDDSLQLSRKPEKRPNFYYSQQYLEKLSEEYGFGTEKYYLAAKEAVDQGFMNGSAIVGTGYDKPTARASKWLEERLQEPVKEPKEAREKLKDMGEKDGGKKGGPMAGKFGLPDDSLQLSRKPEKRPNFYYSQQYLEKLSEEYGFGTEKYYLAAKEAVDQGFMNGSAIVGTGYDKPTARASKWLEERLQEPVKEPKEAREKLKDMAKEKEESKPLSVREKTAAAKNAVKEAAPKAGKSDQDIVADYHAGKTGSVVKLSERAEELLPGIRNSDALQVVATAAEAGGKLPDKFIAQMKRENRVSGSGNPEIAGIEKEIKKFEGALLQYKNMNKVLRNKKMSREQKIEKLKSDFKLSEKTAEALLSPDYAGRTGIPAFELTSVRGKIKRLKEKVVEKERSLTLNTDPVHFSNDVGGIVIDSEDDDRIQMDFNGKPSKEMRAKLISAGFRWTPSKQLWQAYRTERSRRNVRDILGTDPFKTKKGLRMTFSSFLRK